MTDRPSPTNASQPCIFYARREAQERAAAERSPSRAVRSLHLELARRYAALRTDGQDAA